VSQKLRSFPECCILVNTRVDSESIMKPMESFEELAVLAGGRAADLYHAEIGYIYWLSV